MQLSSTGSRPPGKGSADSAPAGRERREVLWDVHVGHTWRHDRAQRHQMEPLWKSLEAVEQDLLDMQAVHRYLRDRETRNRLCEFSHAACAFCPGPPCTLHL